MASRDKGIILKSDANTGLYVWVYANYCGSWDREYAIEDPTTARSRSGGYVIWCYGCPVTWRFKLQMEVALSTTEAEYGTLLWDYVIWMYVCTFLYEYIPASYNSFNHWTSSVKIFSFMRTLNITGTCSTRAFWYVILMRSSYVSIRINIARMTIIRTSRMYKMSRSINRFINQANLTSSAHRSIPSSQFGFERLHSNKAASIATRA